MPFPVILAHGALGIWDEVIFVGIAVVFLVMMGVSWVKSRNAEPESDTPPAQQSDHDEAPERFRLD